MSNIQGGGDLLRPNVSVCVDSTHIHFNPIIPPQYNKAIFNVTSLPTKLCGIIGAFESFKVNGEEMVKHGEIVEPTCFIDENVHITDYSSLDESWFIPQINTYNTIELGIGREIEEGEGLLMCQKMGDECYGVIFDYDSVNAFFSYNDGTYVLADATTLPALAIAFIFVHSGYVDEDETIIDAYTIETSFKATKEIFPERKIAEKTYEHRIIESQEDIDSLYYDNNSFSSCIIHPKEQLDDNTRLYFLFNDDGDIVIRSNILGGLVEMGLVTYDDVANTYTITHDQLTPLELESLDNMIVFLGFENNEAQETEIPFTIIQQNTEYFLLDYDPHAPIYASNTGTCNVEFLMKSHDIISSYALMLYGNTEESTMVSLELSNEIKTIMGGAFGYCNIETLRLPDNITYLARDAFMDCNIKHLYTGDGVTSLGDAFRSDRHIESIHYGKNIENPNLATSSEDISTMQIPIITVDEDNPYFDSRNNCNGVIRTAENKLVLGYNNTVIPDTVKELGTLSLILNTDKFILPASIERINKAILSHGSTEIICYATTPPTIIDSLGFYAGYTFKVYVPSESVDLYKSTFGWLSNSIYPIES